MELYKLRYNLYNYFIQNTTFYEINVANANIWFNALIVYYTFFTFLLLINYDKISISTILFIIIGVIFLYYCYLLNIKLTNVIENKTFIDYITYYKLFNSIFIDGYNNNTVNLYIKDINKNVDFSLDNIIKLKYTTIDITQSSNQYTTIGSPETNQLLTNNGVISTIQPIEIITADDNYIYINYKNNGKLKIEDNDLTCDIFMIGGGGAGGYMAGGGGGGGEIIIKQDYIFKIDTYNINIGGIAIASKIDIINGNPTEILNSNNKSLLKCEGGGGGGKYESNGNNSNGGGGGAGSVSLKVKKTLNGKSLNKHGNGGLSSSHAGGGGGGYKKNGNDAILSEDVGGNGGDGYNIIDFNNMNEMYGCGGGGGTFFAERSNNNCNSGKGGTINFNGEDGLINTGSGGGGGGGFTENIIDNRLGGNGGSGLVIIKIKKENINIDINASNEIIIKKKKNIIKNIKLITQNKQYLLIIVNNKNEHMFINYLINNYNNEEYNKIIFKLDKSAITSKNIILELQGECYLIDINKLNNYQKLKLYKYLIEYLKKINKITQIDLNKESSTSFINNYISYIGLDTKTNYLDYFYTTLMTIRTNIKNNENVLKEDMNKFIEDNIKNNDILKYIDIYNERYDNLKKYVFIKKDDTDSIYEYINTNYNNNKDNYISIDNNETIIINTVIIQLITADDIKGYIININTINNYLNDKEKNNSNVSSYIIKIYNDLLSYYNRKNNLTIDNFDILYKNQKNIDKIIEEQIDSYIYIFNIIIVLIVVILTIIMHIFYIKLYNPIRII